MSVVIRLDAIPISGLPQIVKSDLVEPSSTKVNCVLHCEQLPTHQRLEVRMNDVLQHGVSEGNQMVFSWQLVKASDLISIKLFNRGAVTKHWQGCWNERDAILHLGALPIQVFFAGKPQPLLAVVGGITSAATLAAMHSAADAEEFNGNGQSVVISDLKNDPHEERNNKRVVVVQDLLVIAEAEPDEESDEVINEEVDGVIDEELDEVVDKDSEPDEEPDEAIDEEVYEVMDEETYYDVTDGDVEEEIIEYETDKEVGDDGIEPAMIQGEQQATESVTPRIAAFHARSLAYEETLEALKRLMATMPPKTIIIDLRRHSRTKKRHQGQRELSKDCLRAAFGGKYWDRGWAIQTTYRRDSSSEEQFSRWRQALVDPDQYPDGIPSLVKHLQEGCSMVVMDSSASYEESPRRAVIEELQKHLSNLAVGPIG